MDDLPKNADLCVVPSSATTVVAAAASSHRSGLDMWRMSRAFSRSEFDLVVFPTIYSYVPVMSRAKKIVFIHDVIPEKYPNLTVPNLTSRFLWKTKLGVGRRQADAIVTVSEYSRRRILNHFKMAPDRVHVVGEASDPAFRVLENPSLTKRLASLRLAPQGRRILYVGGFSPHKNLETLIDVFRQISRREEFADVTLVFVGETEKEVFHSYFDFIARQVEDLGLSRRVCFTGYVSDEELIVLLNLSTVLVLPSLMEGFGLPAVEAAACGCPVIATRESPLPELLGEGGFYIDPLEPEQLERSLVRILTSEATRLQMREAGIAAARALTWEQAAGDLLQVFDRVINS